MTDRVECAVIGAGVVGLAIAKVLAESGREVVVLESERAIGSITSSRNSEVIHAGIYYPTGSLKARLCVEGKKALYHYAAAHGVPTLKCQKLIVATDERELPVLESIAGKAKANGVGDLCFVDAVDAMAMEPNLYCVGALLSPSTGIVDSHALMLAYQGDAEAAGAMIAFDAPVLGGRVADCETILRIGGASPMALIAKYVINSAGLTAQKLASRIEGFPKEKVPPSFYCKGNYFALTGGRPFERLIYPVPPKAGLGVHVTRDISGRIKFGPDFEWIDDPNDYSLDPGRAGEFYEAVRRYYPGLAEGALQPDYTGIRPKVAKPGGAGEDFVILGPMDHGVAGHVHLFGMESPGLTASLAIGDYVRRLL